jgi:hypothetical protein
LYRVPPAGPEYLCKIFACGLTLKDHYGVSCTVIKMAMTLVVTEFHCKENWCLDVSGDVQVWLLKDRM